jgi:DUF4097 and DUF4098 domain-containing protein YvlB
MHRSFTTPGPVSLYVELRAGDLVVRTTETDETVVDVQTGASGADGDGPDGQEARDVVVDLRGDEVLVVAKQSRSGFFGAAPTDRLLVRVTVPRDSRLTTKLGSADVRVEGRLGATMLKSGSGDVRIEELAAEAFVATGSGDVQVDVASGTLRVKCGSGDVTVDRLLGPGDISTGSGDVLVNAAEGPVTVRSGSGDARVRDARQDLFLNTASGDLVVERIRRGQLTAKNVSGDITVGVPAGVPVWTDISTMTGSVRSQLDGAGEAGEGQEFVELRAKTVSGDVLLEQV